MDSFFWFHFEIPLLIQSILKSSTLPEVGQVLKINLFMILALLSSI